MKNIKIGLIFGFYCLVMIWAVMLISEVFPLIRQFGVVPREMSTRSLLGIFVSPLIHESFPHIIANSIPLFILIVTLTISYQRITIRVILFSILLGDSLVWLFGRQASHIGASGLIFALIGFLIFSVFFQKNWKSLIVAVIIGFLYGTCIFGIFPSDPHVSWEAHLFGFLAGIYLAYAYRKTSHSSVVVQ